MTTSVIAHNTNARYDPLKQVRAGAMTDEQTELEKRVRAGEWLKAGAVATLLGIGRTKVHTLLTQGVIRHRKTPGGVQRVCSPDDVLRLLEEGRRTHGEGPAEPAGT